MKISEVTDELIRDYCGIYEEESGGVLEVAKAAALACIREETKLSAEEIDRLEDLTLAYLCLINDGFYSRDYTLSWQKQINPYTEKILNMHRRNYL